MASINGIQVKEYIQALSDEGKLQVDKIGSGNWYWCFSSEEKKQLEIKLAAQEQEATKVRKSCEDAESALATEKRQQEADREDNDEEERDGMMKRKAEVQTEIRGLQAEERELTDALSSGTGGVVKKREEIPTLKQEAMMWTDNIYILEQYIKKLAGGDGKVVAAVQRECYGEEFEEDVGLRELP